MRFSSSTASTASSTLLAWDAEFQVQIAELLGFDGCGGFGHEVGGFGGFGEGDDVADARGAAEDGDEAVEAEGDAAVGRRAVAEGFEHVAEAGLDHIRWNLKDFLEDGFL